MLLISQEATRNEDDIPKKGNDFPGTVRDTTS